MPSHSRPRPAPGESSTWPHSRGHAWLHWARRSPDVSTNDEEFCQELLGTCRLTGERAWRLPLDDDYKEQLRSNVADLKNVGGKWGGAVIAAKFLEQFVDARPWIHLDIAGPSWNDADHASRDVGATGCFVRTLVAMLESRESGLTCSGDRSGRFHPPPPPRIEIRLNSTAIDIQCLENPQYLVHFIHAINALGPDDDVEVFFEDLESIENRIDERRVAEVTLEQSEILVIEFNPEGLAL